MKTLVIHPKDLEVTLITEDISRKDALLQKLIELIKV